MRETVEKLAILTMAFVLLALWTVAVVQMSWGKWEDKYYTKMAKKEPHKYDFCKACGRMRPHKRMLSNKVCYPYCSDEGQGGDTNAR